MTAETKFGPLESLVGRTFEKDGEYRSFESVYPFQIAVLGKRGRLVAGSVIAVDAAWLPSALLDWLSGAEEVAQ